MDEASFHERADDLLESILEAVEIADSDGKLSLDLLEGVLTITIDEDTEYVINKHEPTTRIWMSSPESGASRFAYQEDEDEWHNTNGESIKEVISDELERLAEIDVEF